jgi:hypothetical protein
VTRRDDWRLTRQVLRASGKARKRVWAFSSVQRTFALAEGRGSHPVSQPARKRGQRAKRVACPFLL